MSRVRPKKHLGQHFLKDNNIAAKIVDSLKATGVPDVLEIGPGMGVLTRYLLTDKPYQAHLIEIDKESVDYLEQAYPAVKDWIIHADFLKFDLKSHFPEKLAIIGNFPYNISSQIFFKILENREIVQEVVCMLQKEVAERISVKHGTKVYGILSVLLQSFYTIEYLFTVNENVFIPPPKVKSAVIRLVRNNREKLPCNERLFVKIVKAGFNQRRKTLRNSLKSILLNLGYDHEYLSMRPEQLSIEQFIELTADIEHKIDGFKI